MLLPFIVCSNYLNHNNNNSGFDAVWAKCMEWYASLSSNSKGLHEIAKVIFRIKNQYTHMYTPPVYQLVYCTLWLSGSANGRSNGVLCHHRQQMSITHAYQPGLDISFTFIVFISVMEKSEMHTKSVWGRFARTKSALRMIISERCCFSLSSWNKIT